MPTYEYRCEACGHTFDIIQGFADAALTTCDVCGGTLRKVYAPVGIVFKGSGFYKTDSRGSGSSRSTVPSQKEAASSDSAGSDSATSDTKAPKEAPSSAKEPAATKKDAKPASTTSATKD